MKRILTLSVFLAALVGVPWAQTPGSYATAVTGATSGTFDSTGATAIVELCTATTSATLTATTPNDNKGNSYTSVFGPDGSEIVTGDGADSTVYARIYISYGPSSTGTGTISYCPTGSSSTTVVAAKGTGTTSAALDRVSVGPITTTNANDIVFDFGWSDLYSGDALTGTPTGTTALGSLVTLSNTADNTGIAYKVLTSTLTTAQWVWPGTGSYFSPGNYYVGLKQVVVATPVITPSSGVVPQNPVLTDTTAGAGILYTTDGSSPSHGPTSCAPICTVGVQCTSSTTSGNAIGTIVVPFTLKAMACLSGYADSAVATATFTPALSPIITSPATLPSGIVGIAYGYQLVASSGTSPYTWSVNGYSSLSSIGGACSNLSLSSAGAIAGTPTTGGTCSFTGVVTDALSNTATQNFSITIAALAMITTSPLASGTLNSAYSTTLSAGGGQFPLSWSIVSGAPAGLSINSSTGVLSGTPTAPGSYNVVIRVADAGTQSIQQSFALTIASSGAAATPTFSPAGGNYSSAQSITISDTTSGAAIHYTVDGSTPTCSSPTYSTALTVSAAETINAIACATGYSNSSVGSATYTFASQAYQLTVATNGGGGTGTVSGTNCTSGVSYAPGTSISCTATAATGSTFSTMTGCGLTLSSNVLSGTMPSSSCTLTATFTLNSYTITTSVGSHGTMTCPSSVSYGATGSCTVTPNSGYTASVSGCGGSLSGTSYSWTQGAGACTVTASFPAAYTGGWVIRY